MAFRDEYKKELDTKLSALEARYNGLVKSINTLERKLDKSTPWPISTAIGSKIRAFGVDTMFYLVALVTVTALVGIIGYTIHMSILEDNIPDHCEYSNSGNGSWKVLGDPNWGQYQHYGEYGTIEQAKEIGKLNGCPN